MFKTIKRYFNRTKWRNHEQTYSLVKVFDRDGFTYSRFPKELNMPLERLGQSMFLLELLSSGVSGAELTKILDKMDEALADGLTKPKNAAIVAQYIAIIRERSESIIHQDVLLNIAAMWIIRSDENPNIINPDIHQQKINLFMAMTKEGSHDFFTRLHISPLIPLLTMSPDHFQALWEYNAIQVKELNRKLAVLDSHRDTEQTK